MFDYQPYTPPADRRPGKPPRPSIHTDIVALNGAAGPDVWTQFTVGPRGAVPHDPYDGDIREHLLDLTRAARAADLRINYRVLNAATGEHVPTTKRDDQGNVTTADQVLTDAGIPAVVVFDARPKRA